MESFGTVAMNGFIVSYHLFSFCTSSPGMNELINIEH